MSDPVASATGQRRRRAPLWFDALIVVRAVALVVIFVNWLGPIGLLPALVLVGVTSYWLAGIERRWTHG